MEAPWQIRADHDVPVRDEIPHLPVVEEIVPLCHAPLPSVLDLPRLTDPLNRLPPNVMPVAVRCNRDAESTSAAEPGAPRLIFPDGIGLIQ